MDIDTNNQANDNELEEFNEIPMTSNGDVVMIIAWGVGGVVAVVAVLLWLMIMMMIRAILAFMLDNFGVSGIAIITLGFIYFSVQYGHISYKLIWTVFWKSCS